MDFHDGVGEEEQMFSMGHSCIRGQYQGKTILLDYEELCPTKNELVSSIKTSIRYKLAGAYSEQWVRASLASLCCVLEQEH